MNERHERIANARLILRQHPEIKEIISLLQVKDRLQGKHARQAESTMRTLNSIAPNGGDIGGIRGRSRRSKEKSFNRSFQVARQHVQETQTIEGIGIKIKRLARRITQRRRYGDPEFLEKRNRLYQQIAFTIVWDSIKVGDGVHIGGNQPAKVTKKNKKSYASDLCVFTVKETIGFDPDKEPGLRDRVAQYRADPQSIPGMDRIIERAEKMLLVRGNS